MSCDGVASPALLVAVDGCSLLWMAACRGYRRRELRYSTAGHLAA